MAEKLKLALNPGRTLAESMRTIAFDDVVEAVRLCCLAAATRLPDDVLSALQHKIEQAKHIEEQMKKKQ